MPFAVQSIASLGKHFVFETGGGAVLAVFIISLAVGLMVGPLLKKRSRDFDGY